ncbi:hypothetical protein Maq22A_c28815 [Methylobacterium aquaticum]|uniref:Uncharacterized protein n=1 Tax=Methylobacterium aquaticum TaxID=270351 RepID=A0A1Y0Z8V2_9HYPH|nr:hypothetical protein Maq22A_c28815 [Methylobacterium aquaticum]
MPTSADTASRSGSVHVAEASGPGSCTIGEVERPSFPPVPGSERLHRPSGPPRSAFGKIPREKPGCRPALRLSGADSRVAMPTI